MDADHAVTGIAAQNLGLVLRPNALACGLSHDQVDGRLERGRWDRLHARVYRVAGADFAYPELKLAIEVDGYGPHSSMEAFQHDRTRQNELVELGWTVLRFTWDDVVRRPAIVAAQIHRVLGTI